MQCFAFYTVNKFPITSAQNWLKINSLFAKLAIQPVLMIMFTLMMVNFFMTNSGNGREDLRLMTNELSEHGTKGSVMVSGQYSSHFF